MRDSRDNEVTLLLVGHVLDGVGNCSRCAPRGVQNLGVEAGCPCRGAWDSSCPCRR